MMIKGKKIENRTILIVLAVLLIILFGYYVATNLPEQKNYLAVEEVLRNSSNYLNGQTIIVRGYYDSVQHAIVSTMSTTEGRAVLLLDSSNIQDAATTLLNGVKFDFTGTLHEIDVGGPNNNLEFVASAIEVV